MDDRKNADEEKVQEKYSQDYERSETQDSKKAIDEIEIDGIIYTKHTPLPDLKNLSYELADKESEKLSGDQAKALFYWIATKERYGDDVYKQKERGALKDDGLLSDLKDRVSEQREVKYKLRRQIEDIQGHSRSTVDGEYTEIWGADKSAIAAGPMGAASGGLRPVGPSQFFKIVQKQLNDVAFRQSLQEEAKARQAAAKDMAEIKRLCAGSMGSWTESSIEKEISKLGKEPIYKEVTTTEIDRSMTELRTLKHSEYMRNPNRDNRDIEEYQLPGPGAGMNGAFGVF